MSRPGPGVLLVTTDSNSRSKNGRSQPFQQVAGRTRRRRSGSRAPFATADATAAESASGVKAGTNLRAVRLLNGPVLIQNSFV